jgi:hypothetical protein
MPQPIHRSSSVALAVATGLAALAGLTVAATPAHAEETLEVHRDDDATPASRFGLALGLPVTGGGNDGAQTLAFTVSFSRDLLYAEGDFQAFRGFESQRTLMGGGAGVAVDFGSTNARLLMTANYALSNEEHSPDGLTSRYDAHMLGAKAAFAWTADFGLDLRVGVAAFRAVGDIDAGDRNPAPQVGDAEPGKTSAYAFTRVGFVF